MAKDYTPVYLTHVQQAPVSNMERTSSENF